MYNIIVRPAATLMTKHAFDWYEEQKTGLGEEFLAELRGCYTKYRIPPFLTLK